jgi:transcriptional regulator with XRE-family HTH domain
MTKTAGLIGISDSAYSKLEKGINNPSDRTVTLFCQKLHVSETWLRTGEGEMEETDLFEDLVSAYDLGPAAQALMRSLARVLGELGEDACNKVIEDLLAELQAGIANRQAASVTFPQAPADEDESSASSSGSVVG